MQRLDEVTYHTQRATRELDLGLTAQTTTVARAHLKLASMHMSRLRELTGESLVPPVAILG
jgi:hypothetical protein